jgi:hypothetical protein
VIALAAVTAGAIALVALDAVKGGAIALIDVPVGRAPELGCAPERAAMLEARVAALRVSMADTSVERDAGTTPDPAAPVVGTTSALRSVCAARQWATMLPVGDLIALIGGRPPDDDRDVLLRDAEAWDGVHRLEFGHLAVNRAGATAVALPDGRPLLAGGMRIENESSVGAIELGVRGGPRGQVAWRTAGALATPRWSATATVLADGATVMFAGGRSASDDSIDDPTGIELWRDGKVTAGGAMLVARMGHSATLLPDDRVLIVGGPIWRGERIAAEIYDPIARVSHRAAPSHDVRRSHTATRLLDGRVLVVGGTDMNATSSTSLASAELFDPRTGTWTPAHPLAFARDGHTAVLLRDGRVLVAGGVLWRCPDWCNAYTVEALEIWDPATDRWELAGRFPSRWVEAVELPGGQVNLIGPQDEWRNYLAMTWTP